MPPGSKKRKAAKKKKGSSQDKPSLDTHVEDASATSLPSPGNGDKEGSDSGGSDIVSPRNPEAPEAGVSESKEEGKEDFSSGGSTAAAMDTAENGAKVVEAEEGPVAPVQAEEVPTIEEPKVMESDLTPPESDIQVPVFYDGGAPVELVEATDIEVPVIHDGRVTVEHVEAPNEEDAITAADDSAQPVVEPQEVVEIPREVSLDEKQDTTSEPAEASREVSVDEKLDTAPEPAEAPREVSLDKKLDTAPEPAETPTQVSVDEKLETTPEPAEASREVQLEEPSDAAAAVVEPPGSPVPVSHEPAVPEPGHVMVEKVEPSRSVEPTSEVKESQPITSSAYSEQPQANTETGVRAQESRGIGAEVFLPPQSASRASWWNCCGLCDVFAGNR